MGLFRNKYDKLTREEVVAAICELEQQLHTIEEELVDKKKQISELMAKGKAETDRDVKLFYAKKINALKSERAQSVQRAMYLMYNIQLLNKLKGAIDDNKFFKNTTKASLGNLLADQKGLARFLNKALNTRIAAEDVLTSADELFNDVESAYERSDAIYGMSQDDDALLAMFEAEETVALEQEMSDSIATPKKDTE